MGASMGNSSMYAVASGSFVKLLKGALQRTRELCEAPFRGVS